MSGMAMKPPDSKPERLREPQDLEMRDWGDDLLFAETDNVGGWIMIDPESAVPIEQ